MTRSGLLRVVLGALGALGVGYGAVLLAARPGDLVAAGAWLAAGVLLHDGVLAPAVVAVCLLGLRLPARLRGPAAGGLVVLGSVTLVAVPVLGRFGARADNPTLLDRDYGTGWLLVAGLTMLGVLVTTVVGGRPGAAGRSGDGEDPGRR